MPPIIVKGCDVPPPLLGGSPVPELPARLMGDEKQWYLYIQALIELKDDDPTAPLSRFSLSSIHGYPPNFPWQGGGEKHHGYCAHSEQALQIAAVKVSKRYTTDSDAWGRAALTLRFPYWDWADPNTYLPPPQVYDYDNFKTLNIITPDGPQDIPNPFLAYTFQREIEWPDSAGLSQCKIVDSARYVASEQMGTNAVGDFPNSTKTG